jgi:hypothetical protein
MCKQRNRRQSGHGRPVGTVPVDVNPMRSKAKRTWMGCCRCTPAWLYVYACFALVLLVLGFRPWPPRDLLLVEARAIGRSRTTHVGDCRRVPVLATGRTGGECVGTQGMVVDGNGMNPRPPEPPPAPAVTIQVPSLRSTTVPFQSVAANRIRS